MSAAARGQAEGGAAHRFVLCVKTTSSELNGQPKATAAQQTTDATRRNTEVAKREPITFDYAPASSTASPEATVT
jgi:hypothetical protein